MIVKYIMPFIILISLLSCTNKDFEKRLIVKSLPVNVSSVTNEANVLRGYAAKLNQIDIDKNLSKLKQKVDKEKFKYRILEFKIAYNKCVDKVVEIEAPNSKDKMKKIGQLKEDMLELDAIWQYIVANYEI